MIPIVRTFISLPAGVARMPLGRFTLLTAAGSLPWVLVLALIGREVGDNWDTWRNHLHYVDYAVRRARSSPAIAYLVIAPARRTGRLGADAAEPEPRGPARAAASSALIQGPTELLPVSSSAHLTLLPWLAGWRWQELDSEARKSFEVAVHAGAAAALLIGQRRRIARRAASLRPPPRARGRPLVRAPGHRRATAASARSSGGSAGRARPRAGLDRRARVAWSLADRRPQRRGPGRRRRRRRPGARRRPGGRAGPWRLAKRRDAHRGALARAFTREQANLLSRTVALPVIVGAAVLKGVRLRRRGVEPRAAHRDGVRGRRRRSSRRSPRSG